MQKEARRRQGTFNRPESQRNVKPPLGTNRGHSEKSSRRGHSVSDTEALIGQDKGASRSSDR